MNTRQSQIESFERLSNALKLLIGLDVEEDTLKIEELESQKNYLKEIYLSALSPLCTDIKPYEQIILNSLDAEYNFIFARDVKGADIIAHGNAVIESGDAMYNITYPAYIEGADVMAHRQAVIDINDPKFDVNLFDAIFNKEVDQLMKK